MQCCAEGLYVIGCCCSMFAQWHIETMYEINILPFYGWVEKVTIYIIQCIPAHMRNFILVPLRNKPLYRYVKDIQAICIPFFRMGTHELHSQTETQHRLLQPFNEGIQLVSAQIIHRRTGLAHTRVQSPKAQMLRRWLTRRITESRVPRTIMLSLQNSMLN